MSRAAAIVLAVGAFAMVTGCGEDDGAFTTLPPIRSTTTTTTTTTTTLPQAARVHVVERGETLSVIAERYGVSVAAIVDANQITDPDRIEAGVTLQIPPRVVVP